MRIFQNEPSQGIDEHAHDWHMFTFCSSFRANFWNKKILIKTISRVEMKEKKKQIAEIMKPHVLSFQLMDLYIFNPH